MRMNIPKNTPVRRPDAWPSWSEMTPSGKFVTLCFWFMVVQLINAIFN